MEAPALFIPDGDDYVATILTQGGWDPNAANGGMVLALLGHCLDDVPTLAPMVLSRFTADLVRPVPIGRRLHIVPSIVREGKKIQVVQLVLLSEGVEYVRATALRVRALDVSDIDNLPKSSSDARPADAIVGPHESVSYSKSALGEVGFLCAIDMLQAPMRTGPGFGVWIKFNTPVVAGSPMRPNARLVAVLDFVNLINVDFGRADLSMINADVTGHILRPPISDWIAITGDTRFHAQSGRGVSTATLSDDDGIFAVASTSQLIQHR